LVALGFDDPSPVDSDSRNNYLSRVNVVSDAVAPRAAESPVQMRAHVRAHAVQAPRYIGCSLLISLFTLRFKLFSERSSPSPRGRGVISIEGALRVLMLLNIDFVLLLML
jgi:hypothetical protein